MGGRHARKLPEQAPASSKCLAFADVVRDAAAFRLLMQAVFTVPDRSHALPHRIRRQPLQDVLVDVHKLRQKNQASSGA